MFIENSIIQQQKQVITTRQIESLDILTCTNQEVERILREEFLVNPLLEYSIHKNTSTERDEGVYGSSYNRYASIHDEGKMGEIACKENRTIKDDLIEQLNINKYSKNRFDILNKLMDYLEDDGFFPYDTTSMAKELQIEVKDLLYCLSELKQLEPIGIFSKNIEECLITQLINKGIQDDTLIDLIKNYTSDLLNGNITKISKDMGISVNGVKEYIKVIRNLKPKPIMDVSKDKVEYIIPDIIINRTDDKWDIHINDGWIGDYSYNNYYLKIMKETEDEELLKYFKFNYERAKFIINCVEQRRSTLIRIIEAILETQNNYFLHKQNIKPMRLLDIAKSIGVHPSTVSRAIKGKYLQYKKVILIKDLFQGAMNEVDGKEISTGFIKETIKGLIEDEERVLSDNQISTILNQRGIAISRRTVAKYRVEMNILESSQRRMLK